MVSTAGGASSVYTQPGMRTHPAFGPTVQHLSGPDPNIPTEDFKIAAKKRAIKLVVEQEPGLVAGGMSCAGG